MHCWVRQQTWGVIYYSKQVYRTVMHCIIQYSYQIWLSCSLQSICNTASTFSVNTLHRQYCSVFTTFVMITRSCSKSVSISTFAFPIHFRVKSARPLYDLKWSHKSKWAKMQSMFMQIPNEVSRGYICTSIIKVRIIIKRKRITLEHNP